MVRLSELIAEHHSILRSEGKRDKTKAWYTTNLGAFQSWLEQRPDFSGDAEDITRSMVREYFIHLLEEPRTANNTRTGKLSLTSVQNHHRCLKAFCNRMTTETIRKGQPWLENDFMHRIELPQGEVAEKAILSADDFDKLIEEARLSRNPIRNEALLLLLLDTGMRREEVRTLKVEQVDLANECIIQMKGKGGKRRSMVFSVVTARALNRYLKNRPASEHPEFFLTDTGTPFTENGLYILIHRFGERAGVRVHPHAFRHTFATSMLSAGASTLVVQNMLGHSKPDVTNMYFHMTQNSAREAHERYSPVLTMHHAKRR